MKGKHKAAMWAAVIAAAAGGLATLLLVRANRKPVIIKGAVITRDSDADRELPIANVKIALTNGPASSQSESDSSGFFKLSLPKGIRPGPPAVLEFRHPGYWPLNLNVSAANKLYVARMAPVPPPHAAVFDGPRVSVSDVTVRYTVRETRAVNVGSVVKTFQVVNTGNIPCRHQRPCSPGGKWKAAIRSVSWHAEAGDEFHNARVSCIAGPCPFTKINSKGLSLGGRTVRVSIRDWSDTATFLFEAEVFHPMGSNGMRVSYPVIFGRDLNFTVPASAEGVYIQADIQGSPIVFPLGPALILRWASCNARISSSQSVVYRCELKPGYQLR